MANAVVCNFVKLSVRPAARIDSILRRLDNFRLYPETIDRGVSVSFGGFEAVISLNKKILCLEEKNQAEKSRLTPTTIPLRASPNCATKSTVLHT